MFNFFVVNFSVSFGLDLVFTKVVKNVADCLVCLCCGSILSFVHFGIFLCSVNNNNLLIYIVHISIILF